MNIYSRDVKNIFDRVIDPIIELVKEQVDRVHGKGENVTVSQSPPTLQPVKGAYAAQVFLC
jgi:hypothetical protein